MEQQGFFSRIGNQSVNVMLRSPFHAVLSSGFLLITITGRKSGKPYTLPVNYSHRGDIVTIISRRHRTWWRNLRGGSPVTLCLQGRQVQGWGMVTEDDAGVASALTAFVQTLSRIPKCYRDISLAAQTQVVVQVKLSCEQNSTGYESMNS